MRICFRVDASYQMGTGHVIRCLTLAQALRDHGAECRFICRGHEGNLIELICGRGFEVDVLPNGNKSGQMVDSGLFHAAWLGADWATDAQQTWDLLQGKPVDWLIVDHYALDYRWESALRPRCHRILVIDDIADRRHDCDELLDQNYNSSADSYHHLVPGHCNPMIGPCFALLDSAYAARRTERRERTGKILRVLIYFGGGNATDDLAGTALQAFVCPELADVYLDIVLGAGYAYRASLETKASQRGRVTLHSRLPHLADLMAAADLAIGAGGTTTWERCCMGLPSLVISVAENQRPICEALSREGLIWYCGHSDAVSESSLREEILYLRAHPKVLLELGSAGMQLVDGEGTVRVVEVILG